MNQSSKVVRRSDGLKSALMLPRGPGGPSTTKRPNSIGRPLSLAICSSVISALSTWPLVTWYRADSGNHCNRGISWDELLFSYLGNSPVLCKQIQIEVQLIDPGAIASPGSAQQLGRAQLRNMLPAPKSTTKRRIWRLNPQFSDQNGSKFVSNETWITYIQQYNTLGSLFRR